VFAWRQAGVRSDSLRRGKLTNIWKFSEDRPRGHFPDPRNTLEQGNIAGNTLMPADVLADLTPQADDFLLKEGDGRLQRDLHCFRLVRCRPTIFFLDKKGLDRLHAPHQGHEEAHFRRGSTPEGRRFLETKVGNHAGIGTIRFVALALE
jgi:hypothetical protein